MSPAPHRCTCSHGHRGPPHRGNGDHSSLAQLDCGLPPAQTRGRVEALSFFFSFLFFFTYNITFKQPEVYLRVSLLSTLIFRCRPRCTRRCVQCWRDDTPSTVTDTDFLCCALSSTRCSDWDRSPRWRCRTEPSETAGQLNGNKQGQRQKNCEYC